MYQTQFMSRNMVIFVRNRSLASNLVCELHNDLILPVAQGVFSGAKYDEGIVCIAV